MRAAMPSFPSVLPVAISQFRLHSRNFLIFSSRSFSWSPDLPISTFSASAPLRKRSSMSAVKSMTRCARSCDAAAKVRKATCAVNVRMRTESSGADGGGGTRKNRGARADRQGQTALLLAGIRAADPYSAVVKTLSAVKRLLTLCSPAVVGVIAPRTLDAQRVAGVVREKGVDAAVAG